MKEKKEKNLSGHVLTITDLMDISLCITLTDKKYNSAKQVSHAITNLNKSIAEQLSVCQYNMKFEEW